MLKGTPPRGPRGSSSRGRGGGIQKRKSGGAPGPVRVDKDGDLVMDAPGAGEKRSGRGQIEGTRSTRASTPGRIPTGPSRGGSSRGGNPGTLRAQRNIIRGLETKQANISNSRNISKMSSLEVKGLSSSKAASNPDGGLESLLAFLERKASGHDASTPNRSIKIKKSSMKGDSVIITASSEDIAAIQKLDNFTFAGAPLSIKPFDGPLAKPSDRKKSPEVSNAAAELTEKFRAVLAGRYDANAKLLNLSGLGSDPGLIGMGLFDGSVTTSKVFPAMMVICDKLFTTRQEKSDAIVSITLANNGLVDVSEVTTLAQTFPDIKNLDLSNNSISDIKALQAWRWKFKQLEALVLSGNPIEAQLPALKDELLRRYSQLQTLNGVQVRTPEEIEAARRAAKAGRAPVPISGPDFRDIDHVGENFTRQFLQLYDNDRASLLQTYYDDKTTYSLAINTHSARGRDHSTPVAPWAEYLKHSRNLTRITHLGSRIGRQCQGKQAILEQWSTLPATRHPDLLTSSDKYMIECHPQPGLPDPTGQSPGGVDGLYLAIHGEFEDKIPGVEKSLRSFSRTFLLGPGGPGGPPIRVISDMLSLRGWAPLAQPLLQIAAAPVPVQPILNTDIQQQEALAIQLAEKSRMTLQYAAMCLAETGWNLEGAWAAFCANKHNLPADAFIGGVIPA